MSEPSGPVVSLSALRDALRRARDETSLRQVAREVGLSPRGVTLVINGSQPRNRTLARLRDWYVLRGPSVGGTSEDVAAASLANLLEGLGGAAREHAVVALLAVIEGMHRHHRTDPPEWIAALRNRRV